MPDVSGSHILIVDDQELNRDMLSTRLKKKGFQVDSAAHGEECLKILDQREPDLIILDWMMPVLSGIDTLKQIRLKYSLSELPVIMATARDQSEDVVEALLHGANDYVTKPIDYPVLLARMNAHLKWRHLAKMKDEFLQIASHDLKNPLCTILGGSQLLQSSCKPGTVMTPDNYDLLTRLTKKAVIMKKIIEDFLDMRALQDGEVHLAKETVSLQELVQQCVSSNLPYAASKRIGLHFSSATSNDQVKIDPGKIMQVLENLISNAIKFSPFDTQVEVEVSDTHQNLLVHVRDQGPGFQEGDLQTLFQKYSKPVNRPTGGEKSSGVGLSISKQLAELHGGSIVAANNEGAAGAVFTLHLPKNTSPCG
ncbi:MAG: response regulator [Candidatus Sumerlaeia bacterium]|nr:response regulator [Candidatus Sumerlaeia bacterium]